MADIFKKITNGIDKSIKIVSLKGDELKLKSEIKEIQNSIQIKFQALGKKVYEMLNRGALSEDELKSDWEEITSLFRKLTELENAIKKAELEAMKIRYGADIIVCPECGKPNRSDAKFCINCGSAIVEKRIEGKTCPVCGAFVKEEAKFCIRCGGKLR